MNLKPEEQKLLMESLLDAFIDLSELEIMLRFNLNVKLHEIVTISGDYKYKVFRLIDWAEANGQTEALIRGACQDRPLKAQLIKTAEQIFDARNLSLNKPGESTNRTVQEVSKAPALVFQQIAPHNFDLANVVDECLDQVLERLGLVGFVLPCGFPSVPPNLCDRLRNGFEDPVKVVVRPNIRIDPRVRSVEKGVTQISRYKELARTHNVIAPVGCPDETMISPLWERIRGEFKDPLENKFILIIATPGAWSGLPDLVSLPSPQFRRAHVREWITTIINALQWPNEIILLWEKRFLEQCMIGGELDVDEVYYRIDEASKYLQRRPTWQTFKREFLEMP
jgi:hypothetical protein